MLRLNIIGCGRLGKTLTRLWSDNKVFTIGDVMTQSQNSADEAVALIGAGRAISEWGSFSPAEVWLIATPDGQVPEIPQQLLSHRLIRDGDIVFHCSGALAASVLNSLNKEGAHVASVHPVKSFADVQTSIESFAGTWCGLEGDREALAILQPSFEAIGASCFNIDSQNKSHYHIANVMVCNYLVSLLEVGLRQFEQAGISREQALLITEPILAGTLKNVQSMGTSKALTGPIARSDYDVIERQLSVLKEGDQRVEQIYKLLGSIATDLAIDLAADQATVEQENSDALDRISKLFNSK